MVGLPGTDRDVGSMDIAPFFYRVLKVDRRDNSSRLLGTTFPITPNGGFHYLRSRLFAANVTDQEFVAIYDNETSHLVPVDLRTCILPNNPETRLGFYPECTEQAKGRILSHI